MDGILSVINHGINEHIDHKTNKSSIEIALDYKAMGVVSLSVYRLPVDITVVVSVYRWK